MSEQSRICGRCLCGAVKFTAQVEKAEASVCHCHMCQRWSAGPLFVVECVPGSLRIADEENVAMYRSSEWASRGFCKTCGSVLFWRSHDGKFDAVSAGAIDDKTGLKFTSEIFIDEKPAYYDFANETKRMTGAEFIALITGDDEES